MFRKIICFILIIKLSTICESFVPYLVGHDNAVITDNNLPQNRYNPVVRFPNYLLPRPLPLWRPYPQSYPAYHIVPRLPILGKNGWTNAITARFPTTTTTTTTSTTTTTTTPKPTLTTSTTIKDNEYPTELLDIARNKLGLESRDEIPSLSEFGQLVGTHSPEETLEHIKKLASNEEGIEFMKAYIESADYTDKTSETNSKDLDNEIAQEEDDVVGAIEEPINPNDEGLEVVADDDLNSDYVINNEETPTPVPTPVTENTSSSTERLPHLNSLWDEEDEKNSVSKVAENDEKGNDILKTPLLVKETIPFNYPIPIRIQTSTTSTTLTPPTTSDAAAAVHLNTPKVLIPHIQQISQMTNLPTNQIENFLATNPKIWDLVTKMRRYPINYQRNSPIGAQVVAAVQKAFDEDEDLKKLLNNKEATLL